MEWQGGTDLICGLMGELIWFIRCVVG